MKKIDFYHFGFSAGRIVRLAIFFSLLFGSQLIFAQIFSNPITGISPGLTSPYTTGQTVASGVSVGGIVRGSGITGQSGDNIYNADGWSSNSLDVNDYFEFTITPLPNVTVSFTSFTYTGTSGSGQPPNSFAFRSSVDGFAANIGTATGPGETISLSGSSFQNLTAPITFRFYAWNGNAGGNYALNDFTFSGSALPVELSTFDATTAGKEIQLRWTTESETQNDAFVVERSANGKDFSPLGKVDGAGDSYERRVYEYTDRQPLPGMNYYRLRQQDFSGLEELSKIVSAKITGTDDFTLVPTLVNDKLEIRLGRPAKTDRNVLIFNAQGELVKTVLFREGQDVETIATDDLSAGVYFLKTSDGNEQASYRFVKQ